MKINEKKKLGRGLSALIGDIDLEQSLLSNEEDRVMYLKIDEVIINKDQPRKIFDSEPLQELAESIRSKGIISPIIVRQNEGNKYEIIAGERRYRAAQIANLDKIPVIVKQASDNNAFEIGLIENLQRQDLNVVEEAEAYKNLIDKYSHSQNDIAAIIGKSRSYVTNILRLLNLPPYVLEVLKNGQISMGHARSLIGLDVAEEIANRIVSEGLSVRQVERIVRNAGEIKRDSKEKAYESIAVSDNVKDDIKLIEELLIKKLKTKIKIATYSQNAGNISIEYGSLEELDKILQLLSR